MYMNMLHTFWNYIILKEKKFFFYRARLLSKSHAVIVVQVLYYPWSHCIVDGIQSSVEYISLCLPAPRQQELSTSNNPLPSLTYPLTARYIRRRHKAMNSISQVGLFLQRKLDSQSREQAADYKHEPLYLISEPISKSTVTLCKSLYIHFTFYQSKYYVSLSIFLSGSGRIRQN